MIAFGKRKRKENGKKQKNRMRGLGTDSQEPAEPKSEADQNNEKFMLKQVSVFRFA